ncbi:lipopolysaccharide transport periplasmic protein LptA [Luteibacter aegosomaticola]|uniref:lipopolysaccharide transport periplasmic protein LptA n=1 Tax=Luteibacter aegosomaticola TaxID=2911538 RepID=UPI001FF7A5D7|nr:lipopolysaccharide transport periplasmic protein LptA [Luteibacter aegosomaticola]UPG91765.1 lipopolysaccharide transport periplasmic protein LptA [Luteibacter aegosomaticola]
MRTTLSCLGILMAVGCICVSPLATAKSSDRTVPAKADGNKFSGDIGPDSKSQLDGSVVITQGTLKVTGTHADMYTNQDSALSRVVVTGENAHVEQLDDANLRMTADAQKIDYNVETGLAVLTGSAHAEKQTGGAVSGDVLHYNAHTGTFEAASNGSALIHVTFSPKPASTRTSDK